MKSIVCGIHRWKIVWLAFWKVVLVLLTRKNSEKCFQNIKETKAKNRGGLKRERERERERKTSGGNAATPSIPLGVHKPPLGCVQPPLVLLGVTAPLGASWLLGVALRSHPSCLGWPRGHLLFKKKYSNKYHESLLTWKNKHMLSQNISS